ncbi:MAG TPA: ATP-binding domain-containing protein, partial [Acidimicrobiales bacterium]|nr:ATP-binding domain-containing protein [Acidimicrobiales bacterium]
VREGGDPPQVTRVDPGRLGAEVAARVAAERAAVGEGNVAVVVPDSLADEVSAALDTGGERHGRAGGEQLDAQVSVLAVRLVKGLELDSVLVVEPARIVAEEAQGLRSLYVALTRATRRLTVVHSEPLPEVLVERQPSPA